jgi:RNA polymerase sigma-70 factor (ECF subfamily)
MPGSFWRPAGERKHPLEKLRVRDGSKVQKNEDLGTPQNTDLPPLAGASSRLAAFDEHYRLLFSIAYRMTASVADVEDLLQETFIRWQQAPQSEIRSSQAFLVTILTRLCINHLQSARIRREQYVGQWLPEPIASDPESDPSLAAAVYDSLSMAFLVLLERLTPVERAVFVLREVFDYEYPDIARTLGRSQAGCRQLFRRAQQNIGDARRRFTASALERRQLLERFLQAARGQDMTGLLDLFSSDVVLRSDGGGKAVAVPNLIQGAENVARAILGALGRLVPKNLVSRVTQMNAAPAIIGYLDRKPYSVTSLGAGEGHILEIYVVTNPDKLSHLPELPADSL